MHVDILDRGTLREKCPYLECFWSVFSHIFPNAGKYGPEKLRIRTFFTQWHFGYSTELILKAQVIIAQNCSDKSLTNLNKLRKFVSIIFYISVHLRNLIPAKLTSFGQRRNLIPVNFKNEQPRNLVPLKYFIQNKLHHFCCKFGGIFNAEAVSRRMFHGIAVPKKLS